MSALQVFPADFPGLGFTLSLTVGFEGRSPCLKLSQRGKTALDIRRPADARVVDAGAVVVTVIVGEARSPRNALAEALTGL